MTFRSIHDRPDPLRTPLLLLPVLLVAVLLVPGACGGSEGQADAAAPDLTTVTRGTLRITIKEDGEIKPIRETRVRNRMEGRAQVIYLIEEGTTVEEGEKLVELDSSELVERRAQQAISVAKAEAAYTQAKENFGFLEEELAATESQARSKVVIARMELEKFLGRRRENPQEGGGSGTNQEMVEKLRELVEGGPEVDLEAVAEQGNAGPAAQEQEKVTGNYDELPDKAVELLETDDPEEPTARYRDMGNLANQVLAQVDKIRLARAELEIRRDRLEHSKRLYGREFITKNELEKDRLEFESQQSAVVLAWNDLDLLINYELFKQKLELQQDLANAELELAQVRASNSARKVKEKSDLDSAHQELLLAKERLENLENQIENSVIRAPTPGLVVYAEIERRGDDEMIAEGVEVRERQTLIKLPDTSRMGAELSVHEADIDKVVAGQNAAVTVESLPRPLRAKVTRVAPVPDSGSRWSNNDRKVYKTWVTIEGQNEGQILRPNMSCVIEIVVAELEDVLKVKRPAVMRDRQVHYVWKETPRGPVATRIEIGRSNLSEVQVLEGLEEGDRVYLAPPPQARMKPFEQPEGAQIEPAEELGTPASEERGVAEASSERPEGPGNGGFDMSALRGLMSEIRGVLVEAFPDRAEEINDRRNLRRLLQETGMREVLEREGLLTRYEEMMERMRSLRDRGSFGPPENQGRNQDGSRSRGN